MRSQRVNEALRDAWHDDLSASHDKGVSPRACYGGHTDIYADDDLPRVPHERHFGIAFMRNSKRRRSLSVKRMTIVMKSLSVTIRA